MQCNIDAKGKAVRMVGGLVTLAVAVVLVVLTAVQVVPWWGYLIAVGAALGGAFQVFEARAGWCVIRAMGFKTPV